MEFEAWLHYTGKPNTKVYCPGCAGDLVWEAEVERGNMVRISIPECTEGVLDKNNQGTVWCGYCGRVINPGAELRAARRVM